MKYIKSIVSMMLVSVMILTSMINVNALEASELESGIYEVENDVYHEQEIGMSMSRTYTKPNMKVEVSQDKIYFTVGFTGTDYMENYRILVDGQDIDAEIVAQNEEDHSIDLRFETTSLEPDMEANIYVDAMERDVEFDIITKIDTLKLIEKIEEPQVEELQNSEDTNEVINEEKASDAQEKSSNNTTVIIAVGAVMIGGLAIFIFAKKKK